VLPPFSTIPVAGRTSPSGPHRTFCFGNRPVGFYGRFEFLFLARSRALQQRAVPRLAFFFQIPRRPPPTLTEIPFLCSHYPLARPPLPPATETKLFVLSVIDCYSRLNALGFSEKNPFPVFPVILSPRARCSSFYMLDLSTREAQRPPIRAGKFPPPFTALSYLVSIFRLPSRDQPRLFCGRRSLCRT